jgi:hypothetical protein
LDLAQLLDDDVAHPLVFQSLRLGDRQGRDIRARGRSRASRTYGRRPGATEWCAPGS